jgi:hypothetical protein
MTKRLALVLSLSLAMPLIAGACGVKTDLYTPAGKPTPKNEKDPSKPPNPNNPA